MHPTPAPDGTEIRFKASLEDAATVFANLGSLFHWHHVQPRSVVWSTLPDCPDAMVWLVIEMPDARRDLIIEELKKTGLVSDVRVGTQISLSELGEPPRRTS